MACQMLHRGVKNAAPQQTPRRIAADPSDGKAHPSSGKAQPPPMEKLTAAKRPHRWKSSMTANTIAAFTAVPIIPPIANPMFLMSPSSSGKAHRRRAVASARRMPCFIFFGIRLAAAFRMLLSKSVRFL
jgi:hypothetical protein